MSNTASHCGMEGAVDSMSAYLQDATNGLNAVLTEIRTESSLTAGQLPAVLQFDVDQVIVDRTPAIFVVATAFRDATGESAGRTNSPGRRKGEVDLEVLLYIRGADLTHDSARSQEATVQRAAYRYGAALHRLLTARPARGQSLNGGSGRGLNRIVNVFGFTQDLTVVTDQDGNVTEPNRILMTTISVRTSEE